VHILTATHESVYPEKKMTAKQIHACIYGWIYSRFGYEVTMKEVDCVLNRCDSELLIVKFEDEAGDTKYGAVTHFLEFLRAGRECKLNCVRSFIMC